MHHRVKRIQIYSNEGPCPVARGDNSEKSEDTLMKEIHVKKEIAEIH